MTYFSAGVQYGDWRGDVAADDADIGGIRDYIRKEGLLKEDDRVVGVAFYSGGGDFVDVAALVVRGENAADFDAAIQDPPRKLPMESVDLKLSIADFFKHFKRFNIAIAPKGIEVIGREYDE